MSDEDRKSQNGARNDVFDDDRLLRYALGLEDDPGLAAALAADGRLAQRLDAVRADVAAVERGVHAAVPPEDEGYADPAGSRWEDLRPYFTATPARTRRGFARRVLVPALVSAALVVAAVAGVVALRQHGGNVVSGTHAPKTAAGKANEALGRYQADALAATRQTLLAGAPNYERVALVRAGAVTGGRQQFALLRMLKGSPPGSLDLVLADSKPLPAGQVALAFFDPLPQGGQRTGAVSGAGASPSQLVPPSPSGSPMASAQVTATEFRALGNAVLVLSVPEEVDQATLVLPSPTVTPAR